MLVAHVLGRKRLQLLASPDTTAAPDAVLRAMELAERVLAGEPLQYVLGEWDFMGFSLRLDHNVLIPRPETEILAETALARLAARSSGALTVADVGTGSGCLAIVLAARLTTATIIATDISPAALAVAKYNAQRCNVDSRIRFLETDLLSGLPARSLDAVVSNPPYISRNEFPALPEAVRAYEPRIALDGGPTGLEVTRRLTAQAARALKPGGLYLLETDSRRTRPVKNLLAQHGFRSLFVVKDLAGRERVVGGTLAG